MKRLILTEEGGERAGRRHTLGGGQQALGRDESCQVRFESGEGGVSRRHAVVRAEGDGWFIADQKSANGTQVNSERVLSAWLQAGDLIELGNGGPCLRVSYEEEADTTGMSATDTAGPAEAEAKPKLVDLTLFDPARHAAAKQGPTGMLVVIAMLLIGAALLMLGLLVSVFELGPGAAIVGVIFAFAPAPVYLAIWLWLDRYDPEPAWALAGALVWGAGAATFVSGVANTLFGAIVHSVTQSKAAASFLSASVSAPFVEEATKGLAVLVIFLVLRREFDGVLDGIVYAGVVALGFAAVENVLYYGRSVAKGGAGTLIFVFILRGILGPFSHAIFTGMTGIGCGIARQSHNQVVRFVAPIGGYAAAVFLHALWNTIAGLTGSVGGFLLVYLVLWVPLFLVFMCGVLWMGHRESKLIRRMLTPEVALCLLSQDQADIVGSWPRRLSWIFSSLGDTARLRARRRFLHAATRLALSYWHIERAQAAGGMTLSAGIVPVFRTEVARLATQV